MQVQSSIETFIESPSPEAIVLQGAWGVGKSHLWKAVLGSRRARAASDERSIYVSLFGINSLEALKLAVACAVDYGDDGPVPKAADGRELTRLSRAGAWVGKNFIELRSWEAWRRIPTRIWRSFGRGVPHAVAATPSSLGGGTGLAQAIGALAFYRVRRELICFDDIERHGKDLSLNDFLGLVSYLVEQRQCRVCVILNAAQLSPGDLTIWNDQREKVFSAEVTYNPTAAESIAIGLEKVGNEPWYEDARAALEEIGIRNIRLVRRMVRLLRLVFRAHIPPGLTSVVVRKTIFLEYAHSGSAEGAPPLAFVEKFSAMTRLVEQISARASSTSDGDNEEEAHWANLVEQYGFNGDDDLSRALLDAVLIGFPDLDRISAVVQSIEIDRLRSSDRDDFQEAWSRYHHYVTENGDEVLNAIERTWPKVSGHDNVSNLLSVVNMLRRNGRHARASQFIDQWLLERSGGRADELAPRELSIFAKIDDDEFLRKAEDVRAASASVMPLAEALVCLSERKRMEEAAAAVAASSADQLVDALERNAGPHLPVAIKECLTLRGYQHMEAFETAEARVRDALLIIARRSRWSADRIRLKYGVVCCDEQ